MGQDLVNKAECLKEIFQETEVETVVDHNHGLDQDKGQDHFLMTKDPMILTNQD